jgi:hypothetical protein
LVGEVYDLLRSYPDHGLYLFFTILGRCFNCTASLVSSEAEIFPDLSVPNVLKKQRISHCPELTLVYLRMPFQLQLLLVYDLNSL